MLYSLLLPLTLLFCYNCVTAQGTEIQFVHNAADPQLQVIDVWIEGGQKLEDVTFRTASEPFTVPSGGSIALRIAPQGSSSPDESIASLSVDLPTESRHLVVLTGVLGPEQFQPNPNGTDIGLALIRFPIPEASSNTSIVELSFIHGVTDAPAVDVQPSTAPTFQNLSYGFASSTASSTPSEIIFSIAIAGGQPILAYKGNFDLYAGQFVYVIASGFLVPALNQNGRPFGLFVIPPTGGPLRQLQPTAVPTSARVQFIHTAADPALSAVDVYIAGVLAADDVGFRTATQFVDIPSNTDIQVAIAPSSSSGVGDAFVSFTKNFQTGRYAVLLDGVLNPNDFASNPDGRVPSIGINVTTIPEIRPISTSPAEVDIIYAHACTDAPSVSIEHNQEIIWEDLYYGTFTNYTSLEAGPTTVKIGFSGHAPDISIPVNFLPIAGEPIIVVLSGFLKPENNQNGPPLGLWVAKNSGGPLFELQAVTTVPAAEMFVHSGVSVIPNPAHGAISVHVNSECTVENLLITIVSPDGRTVSNRWYPCTGLQTIVEMHDVDLAPGMYYVFVYAGTRTQTASFAVLP